jgi:hypothetical protein
MTAAAAEHWHYLPDVSPHRRQARVFLARLWADLRIPGSPWPLEFVRVEDCDQHARHHRDGAGCPRDSWSDLRLLLGRCNRPDQVISIDAKLGWDETMRVVFHEALHAAGREEEAVRKHEGEWPSFFARLMGRGW